jgi:hypothetical protein
MNVILIQGENAGLSMTRTLTSPLPSPLPPRERRGRIVSPFLAKSVTLVVTWFRGSMRKVCGWGIFA